MGEARIWLYLLCIFVWVLTGCQFPVQTPFPTPTPTLEPSQMDKSLLTDTPCPAPCWYGLELEKSSKADVLTTLQTLSFINSNSIDESAEGYLDPITNKN